MKNNHLIQTVILCGGAGTRLWPASRKYYPKQFLPLVTERTLLQDTAARLDDFTMDSWRIAEPIIVCNEEHRFLVAEQIRQLDRNAARIMLEPVGRNTAPALTLAALAAVEQGDDPVLLVMPADHAIQDSAAFFGAVRAGTEMAAKDYLVTFGVVPGRPETGYGYLLAGENITAERAQAAEASPAVCRLERFVEKPDMETATEYVQSGNYLWNSGIFMMRASVWLEKLNQFRPDIMASCQQAFDSQLSDGDFSRLDSAIFSECPSDSIDYAVMEKVASESSCVVALDAEWSDVGAWRALWDISKRDEDGNVTRGDVCSHATRNSLLFSESRLVTAVGLDNIVVVETADAVLVADKDQAQDVKLIVNQLIDGDRAEPSFHRRIHRPWGTYENVDVSERFQVKRIVVNPGATLSLQMHHHRAEHWIVVTGTAKVTCGDKVFLVTENQSTYISVGEKHRLENPGMVPLELIEVQCGSYLGEDDIVRYDDNYGRADT
ncbi:MAG: mannose-1-phosphate guanylyltransferase/mannose-6-phosphate isomerase [Gammaproteobacteria bacterium]|nr:mannose-1-phosphate guanylyltransferase/mannose-6-phosphate isomerase [Gammaproteobacteria bacterium]